MCLVVVELSKEDYASPQSFNNESNPREKRKVSKSGTKATAVNSGKSPNDYPVPNAFTDSSNDMTLQKPWGKLGIR